MKLLLFNQPWFRAVCHCCKLLVVSEVEYEDEDDEAEEEEEEEEKLGEN